MFGLGRRRWRWVLAPAAAALFGVGLTGCTAQVSITTDTALFPAFDPSITDYVDRCDPSSPTAVTVDAPAGTTVSVNGQDDRSGSFTTDVEAEYGKRFVIEVTIDDVTTRHNIRCLPEDFPEWSAQRTGTPQSQFYSTVLFEAEQALSGGEGSYSVVFDTNGVPVWWLPREQTYLLQTLSNGNFVTMDQAGGMREYDLNGQVVRTLDTVGAPSDFHDVQLLPNGNYVMATYTTQPCNLSSWGLSATTNCINHVFQELRPNGTVAWQWDTATNIPVTETPEHWRQYEREDRGPFPTPNLYDPWHYNAVEHTGDGFIISFRHLDAIYKVDQATGTIDWKLSGTPRAESLTLVDDPLSGVRGQHDARLLSGGRVSIYDNGTIGSSAPREPRLVVYAVDETQRTATRTGATRDASVPGSFCCGSARVLPGGNRVIGWGGTARMNEYEADGDSVFQLNGTFVYRGLPILPGEYTSEEFQTGMDYQFASK